MTSSQHTVATLITFVTVSLAVIVLESESEENILCIVCHV